MMNPVEVYDTAESIDMLRVAREQRSLTGEEKRLLRNAQARLRRFSNKGRSANLVEKAVEAQERIKQLEAYAKRLSKKMTEKQLDQYHLEIGKMFDKGKTKR